MSDDDETDNTESLQALMQMQEEFLVISDVAQGYKKSLIERGWSEDVAEEAGGEMLIGMIRHVYATLEVGLYK